MADHSLDTSGLDCPLPILKTKKRLASLKPGETLEVIATDPGSAQDFKAFCSATGHTLLESQERDGTFRFVLKHTKRP
jgi:tRNA 2-thiouridine synthesizing protein A